MNLREKNFDVDKKRSFYEFLKKLKILFSGLRSTRAAYHMMNVLKVVT